MTLVKVTPPWTSAKSTEPPSSEFAVAFAVEGDCAPQPPTSDAVNERIARIDTLRIVRNKVTLQVIEPDSRIQTSRHHGSEEWSVEYAENLAGEFRPRAAVSVEVHRYSNECLRISVITSCARLLVDVRNESLFSWISAWVSAARQT